MAGNNSVKMADLVILYRELGFADAETYIQSGNVIFTSAQPLPVDEISLKIETAILNRFNLNVRVILRTLHEIREIISLNPFLSEERFDPARMAVIFVHEKISGDHIQKVADLDYPPDKFRIIGNDIFTFCPDGFGNTKLYTNFFERKMGITGTARNWKTITTLLNIASGFE